MLQQDALWFTRGPGSVDHVRQVVCGHVADRVLLTLTGDPVQVGIQAHDLRRVFRKALPVALLRQQNRYPGVL